MTTYRLHRGDLPEGFEGGASVAVDTETLGLVPGRDRLCLVQVSRGEGSADLVQVRPGDQEPVRLKRLMVDEACLKIFHFARFDLAMLLQGIGVMPRPVYCTKIASRLTRTYTDRHGLKDIVRELVGVEISKQSQSSDWGAEALSEAQLAYAASDVLYLHALKERFDARLAREGRTALAQACFDFLPARAELDLAGWPETDIFAHS